MHRLLLAARGEEVRYLVRTLGQNLRVGAVKLTLQSALARAFSLRAHTRDIEAGFAVPSFPQSTVEQIQEAMTAADMHLRRIYVQHPNYNHIVPVLLEEGLSSLAERCPLSLGVPLAPMLGSITRSLQEVYDRLNGAPFVSEWKYDGQRAQIHASVLSASEPPWGKVSIDELTGKRIAVRIFSRHLEDQTEKYPDIVGLAHQLLLKLPIEDCEFPNFIVDAEVVAVDVTTGDLKTFQELTTRSKKVCIVCSTQS